MVIASKALPSSVPTSRSGRAGFTPARHRLTAASATASLFRFPTMQSTPGMAAMASAAFCAEQPVTIKNASGFSDSRRRIACRAFAVGFCRHGTGIDHVKIADLLRRTDRKAARRQCLRQSLRFVLIDFAALRRTAALGRDSVTDIAETSPCGTAGLAHEHPEPPQLLLL